MVESDGGPYRAPDPSHEWVDRPWWSWWDGYLEFNEYKHLTLLRYEIWLLKNLSYIYFKCMTCIGGFPRSEKEKWIPIADNELRFTTIRIYFRKKSDAIHFQLVFNDQE